MKLSRAFVAVGLSASMLMAGCQYWSPVDNLASYVNPKYLVSAQGHLAPGVMVYDIDGAKLGTVIKVDPDYVFPNFKRGGVLMDYAIKGEPNSYCKLTVINTKLVIPQK